MMDFEEMLEAAASCKVDAAVSSITRTEEREKTLAFSEPYLITSQLLFVKNANSGITSLESENLKPVGVKTDSTSEINLLQFAEDHDVEVVIFESYQKLFIALENEQIDAAVADDLLGKRFVDEFDDIISAGSPITEELYAIAVCPSNTELLSQKQKALKDAIGATKEKLEALITENTVAILPVHVYGNLCDVDRIGAVAARHGLPVIYDAAHSFGVFRGGVSSACFGDAAMFSFHATKAFNTIEGGAVCCHSAEIQKRLCDLKNFGIQDEETVAYIGGNAKMNEFCAAMGLCNLRHLREELEKRRVAAERYEERLSGVPGLQLNAKQPDTQPNYAYYPVLFDDFHWNRDEVFVRLSENGIIPRKYFYPLTSAFACYEGRPGFDPSTTPIAAYTAKRVLTLPMYADLPLETVDRICDIILSRA